jgi:hypothetical protein
MGLVAKHSNVMYMSFSITPYVLWGLPSLVFMSRDHVLVWRGSWWNIANVHVFSIDLMGLVLWGLRVSMSSDTHNTIQQIHIEFSPTRMCTYHVLYVYVLIYMHIYVYIDIILYCVVCLHFENIHTCIYTYICYICTVTHIFTYLYVCTHIHV